jgi:NADPH2:quinone reductase
MKAVRFSAFGGPDVLQYIDTEAPSPGPGEVLVRVRRAGVNYVDLRERAGVYHRAETHVNSGVELPRISGLQAVGVVTAVGPQVDAGLVGREVLAYLPRGGGYAEFAVAAVGMIVALPEGVDPAMFAALPTQALTAWLTLRRSASLQPGESVLVHGAGGGVGSLAVQVAKLLGAGKIIATASTEEKRSLALRLGADVAIPYDTPAWPAAVREHTGGRGVDVILETIGGDVFDQNFACLAPFGRHVVLGSTRGPGKPLEPRRLMEKSQALIGFYLPVFLAVPEWIREGLLFTVEHAARGQLRAHVADVLPLARAADAHRLLEEQKVTGTLVLEVS